MNENLSTFFSFIRSRITIDSNELYESIAVWKLCYLWKEFVCQLEINVIKWQKLFELLNSQLFAYGEIHVENSNSHDVFDLSGVLSFAIRQLYIEIYVQKVHETIFRIDHWEWEIWTSKFNRRLEFPASLLKWK